MLLLNLGMIGLVMWPSFQQQVRPALSESLHKWYFATATVHALLGGTAELLGLYIVIVAGTRVLPESLASRTRSGGCARNSCFGRLSSSPVLGLTTLGI